MEALPAIGSAANRRQYLLDLDSHCAFTWCVGVSRTASLEDHFQVVFRRGSERAEFLKII